MTRDTFTDETVDLAAQGPLADEIPFADGPELTPVDRSAAELYSVCPAQARFIETRRVLNVSQIMEVGNEVHAAYADMVTEYLEISRELTDRLYPSMLVDTAMARLINSRPDLQPDAIRAGQPALFTWAKTLLAIAPQNILKYDGGKGSRSGQLSWEVPSLGVVATSEIDFLHAGPSPTLLHEIDHKSGWKQHSETSVYESFQFGCFHPVLVFANYPEVEALDISVLNTRRNDMTKPARFERKYLPEYEARLMQTLIERGKWVGVAPENTAVWPIVEKCPTCPARALCPGVPPCDVEANPAQFAQHLFTLQGVLDKRYEQAEAYVKRVGKDIHADGGIRFGFDKPPAKSRSPSATLYRVLDKE